MPKFEIEFCDGKTVVRETDTADIAKSQAKIARRNTVARDTPNSAPELKVRSVTRLD